MKTLKWVRPGEILPDGAVFLNQKRLVTVRNPASVVHGEALTESHDEWLYEIPLPQPQYYPGQGAGGGGGTGSYRTGGGNF